VAGYCEYGVGAFCSMKRVEFIEQLKQYSNTKKVSLKLIYLCYF
jgi:hypothetical protein